jgi:hypothetical protein
MYECFEVSPGDLLKAQIVWDVTQFRGVGKVFWTPHLLITIPLRPFWTLENTNPTIKSHISPRKLQYLKILINNSPS